MKTVLDQEGDDLQAFGIQVPLLGRCSVLGWADNRFVMTHSIRQAQEAFDNFTAALHRKGMAWKPTSTQFMLIGTHIETLSNAGAKRPASALEPAGPLMTWLDSGGIRHRFRFGVARMPGHHRRAQHGVSSTLHGHLCFLGASGLLLQYRHTMACQSLWFCSTYTAHCTVWLCHLALEHRGVHDVALPGERLVTTYMPCGMEAR